MQPRNSALTVAVIFATTGRSNVLKNSIDFLARQTRKPEKIVVSCTKQEDVGDLVSRSDVDIIYSDIGLPKQRNAALRHLGGDFDIIIFFDDDFLAHPLWIENVETAFVADEKVGCITGYVVADGIKGPGIAFDAGVSTLAAWSPPPGFELKKDCSPYGCNMAFRHAAVRGLTFDERLPLYGWQEDRDFGSTVISNGWDSVMLWSAGGIHLGVKSGRTSGVRLGYSQVINPIYLCKKGTMSAVETLIQISKNLATNTVFSLYSESYIDRRGRLRGNIIGMKDLLFGRIDPERVVQMK